MTVMDAAPAARSAGAVPAPQAPLWRARATGWIRESVAGCVAAVLVVANIVSFGALMFPGPLSMGVPVVIWAMLVGTGIGGVWIALKSSVPPAACGIDSATGAVFVLMSASVAPGVLAAGGSPEAAVQAAMLILTAATLTSGALLYGLGAAQLGSYFRFIPYFVVGGFLSATGWLLFAGGLRIATGRALSVDGLMPAWTTMELAKLAFAVGAVLVFLALKRWVKSSLAMPAALVAMLVISGVLLRQLGLSGPEHGWYLPTLGTLIPWKPFEALGHAPLTGPMVLGFIPELLAATIVVLVSLVTKITALETSRKTSSDLDREFRAHGLASLMAVPFGGIASSILNGASKLVDHAGGRTRMGGVVCGLVAGVVGLSSFDLPGLIPKPVAAALVFYLGYTFFIDALSKPFSQRAWFDFSMSILIMAVCVKYGYLIGVLAGLMCACLFFAVSCARLGVVRRHLSRAKFASYVTRSTEASRHLTEMGEAIQLYWLSGYVFFGSSEGVFERVRRDILALAPQRVSEVILDFGMVSGIDSSATASLGKLRNFCQRNGTALIYASPSPAVQVALERSGLCSTKVPHTVFADFNQALAWCEGQLLAKATLNDDAGTAEFEPWLQQQLGEQARASDLMAFLDRRQVDESQVIYRQGEPADNVDFVAAGNLVVDITKATGETLRVRRITTHTVVGEMGFFRQAARSATVSSDGPVTLFSMNRANFERLRRERPDLAVAFDDFILRVLSDRITASDLMVGALSP